MPSTDSESDADRPFLRNRRSTCNTINVKEMYEEQKKEREKLENTIEQQKKNRREKNQQRRKLKKEEKTMQGRS